MKRGETIFLEFSVATDTCYLTSHRLITVEHEKGKLEVTRRDYPMKDFLKASTDNQTITVTSPKPPTNHALTSDILLQHAGRNQKCIEQTAKLWNNTKHVKRFRCN